LTAWKSNLGFSMSYMGPDEYVYIGQAAEIPAERLAPLLPGRRKWALKHCRFVKPIVSFDPAAMPDRRTLKADLGLPGSSPLFLAIVGPEGNHAQRVALIEQTFERLREDSPDARFILVSPESEAVPWIRYERFLDDLFRYFAASDLVIAQSGYGKVAELSALGTPFIAIPLDYHFEQEHFMRSRMDHYGVGRLVTMRDHTPQQIAAIARELMERQPPKLEVDSGKEVADIILNAARGDQDRV
jgi:UDP:flavonoid glycosyltransferase YjiC (YdhE family)